jgi:hypothetical protein
MPAERWRNPPAKPQARANLEPESKEESDRARASETESKEESDVFSYPRVRVHGRVRWTQESGSEKNGLCVLPWQENKHHWRSSNLVANRANEPSTRSAVSAQRGESHCVVKATGLHRHSSRCLRKEHNQRYALRSPLHRSITSHIANDASGPPSRRTSTTGVAVASSPTDPTSLRREAHSAQRKPLHRSSSTSLTSETVLAQAAWQESSMIDSSMVVPSVVGTKRRRSKLQRNQTLPDQCRTLLDQCHTYIASARVLVHQQPLSLRTPNCLSEEKHQLRGAAQTNDEHFDSSSAVSSSAMPASASSARRSMSTTDTTHCLRQRSLIANKAKQ